MITEKNHSMTRKNLAKFEYPQTTRVCELLTRQGVNKEESPFIHRLTITDVAMPHKGHKTLDTTMGDGDASQSIGCGSTREARQNVLWTSSRYRSPWTKIDRDDKRRRCQVPNDFTRN